MEVRLTKFEEELHRKDPRSSVYLDTMLSRFNHELQASGLFKELKRRECYVKPSLTRSKKKVDKLAKCRQEGREYALRKKAIEGHGRQSDRRVGSGSKVNTGQRSGRVFELHDK